MSAQSYQIQVFENQFDHLETALILAAKAGATPKECTDYANMLDLFKLQRNLSGVGESIITITEIQFDLLREMLYKAISDPKVPAEIKYSVRSSINLLLAQRVITRIQLSIEDVKLACQISNKILKPELAI